MQDISARFLQVSKLLELILGRMESTLYPSSLVPTQNVADFNFSLSATPMSANRER